MLNVCSRKRDIINISSRFRSIVAIRYFAAISYSSITNTWLSNCDVTVNIQVFHININVIFNSLGNISMHNIFLYIYFTWCCVSRQDLRWDMISNCYAVVWKVLKKKVLFEEITSDSLNVLVSFFQRKFYTRGTQKKLEFAILFHSHSSTCFSKCSPFEAMHRSKIVCPNSRWCWKSYKVMLLTTQSFFFSPLQYLQIPLHQFTSPVMTEKICLR